MLFPLSCILCGDNLPWHLRCLQDPATDGVRLLLLPLFFKQMCGFLPLITAGNLFLQIQRLFLMRERKQTPQRMLHLLFNKIHIVFSTGERNIQRVGKKFIDFR
ncbi:Uncharacterised protein [Shigella flexneri]|nr:Uncharacterised protein [Shigella flexneri]